MGMLITQKSSKICSKLHLKIQIDNEGTTGFLEIKHPSTRCIISNNISILFLTLFVLLSRAKPKENVDLSKEVGKEIITVQRSNDPCKKHCKM